MTKQFLFSLLFVLTTLIFLLTSLFCPINAKAAPSLEEMVGAMLMCGFRGMESPDKDFLTLLAQGHLGHVILFDRDVEKKEPRNIASRSQLKALIKRLRSTKNGPMLIAVDQEGGQVTRLKAQYGFSSIPKAASMGTMTEDSVQAIAFQSGKEMKEVGINLDFAPCVDVASGSHSVIAQLGRSFHQDERIVSSHGQAFAKGLWEAGIIPTLKHFPGIGCASHDSHLGRSDVASCFSESRDLAPYKKAIQEGFCGMIMVGHVHTKMDPVRPASLSPILINGLLRQQLGWNGVVISDDLQMGAIIQQYTLSQAIQMAIEAGVDILLFGNNLNWRENMAQEAYRTLLDLVKKGVIKKERIAQSYARIQGLMAKEKEKGLNEKEYSEITLHSAF